MSLSDPGTDTDLDLDSGTESTDSEEDRKISGELHREVFFSAVGEEGYELTSTRKSTKKGKKSGRKGRSKKRGASKFPDLDDDPLDSGRVSVSTATSGRSYGKLRKLRYTPEEERTVVKKFDRRLVLFVALLYMLSFLDRSSEFCLLLLSVLSWVSGVAVPSPLMLFTSTLLFAHEQNAYNQQTSATPASPAWTKTFNPLLPKTAIMNGP